MARVGLRGRASRNTVAEELAAGEQSVVGQQLRRGRSGRQLQLGWAPLASVAASVCGLVKAA